jgi:hypothetical protein
MKMLMLQGFSPAAKRPNHALQRTLRKRRAAERERWASNTMPLSKTLALGIVLLTLLAPSLVFACSGWKQRPLDARVEGAGYVAYVEVVSVAFSGGYHEAKINVLEQFKGPNLHTIRSPLDSCGTVFKVGERKVYFLNREGIYHDLFQPHGLSTEAVLDQLRAMQPALVQ